MAAPAPLLRCPSLQPACDLSLSLFSSHCRVAGFAALQALKCEIVVHSVGMPVVRLGEQYSASCSITLCYLRHSFGLGEHYNSVQPAGGNSVQPVEAAVA